MQNEYIGLGVLLLDLLAEAHGFVKDSSITAQLGVTGKVANRALRYLQGEGLLASGGCWVLVAPPLGGSQRLEWPGSMPGVVALTCAQSS